MGVTGKVKTTEREKSNHFDFLLIDFISGIIAFAVSYIIKFGDLGFIRDERWMALLFIVCLLNIAICVFSNTYGGILKRPYYEEIIRSALLTFYNLIAASVIFYVFKIGFIFSRQMILTMYGIYFLLSLILKCAWKKLIVSGKIRIYNAKKTKALIVAESEEFETAVHNALAGDFEEYEFCAAFLTDGAKKEYNGIEIIESEDKLVEYCAANGIEEVLVTAAPQTVPNEIYQKLIKNGTSVHMSIESVMGFSTEDYDIDRVGVYSTLSVGKYSFSFGQSAYLGFKRFFDVTAGILGLIILAPVSLSVKAAYLLSGDKSKIIYSQSRIGKNGKKIRIFKFRTMVPDADEALKELLKDEKIRAEWEENQKLSDDPRITKIGRFLRRTSLDELPQLINVMKGEMSLVGPRPLVEGELEAHGGMKLYQKVKPGITGWWGCNGRSNIDYRERLELEYYYVKNFSVYLDILCILRTIVSVLKRDGAE